MKQYFNSEPIFIFEIVLSFIKWSFDDETNNQEFLLNYIQEENIVKNINIQINYV